MKKNVIVLALSGLLSLSALADTQQVELALEANDLVAAELAYSALTDEQQNNITGKVVAGRILIEKEEFEDAFDHFEELTEKYPNNVDANYYLGVSAMIMAQKASIFSKLGYAKDFIKAMEKTVALQPQHLDALNTLVGFHLVAPGIAGGDTDKALTYAQQIRTIDEETGIGQIANVYWQTDKPQLANEVLSEGLEKYPQSAQLYFIRANSNMKKEAWDKARPDLIQAIKFATDDEQLSRALYQQGKASAESGHAIDEGIKALNQAAPLADNQYKPWVNYRLAQLYIHANELAKAKQSLAAIEYGDDDDLKSKVKKLKKKLKKLLS